jgi:hypothetical protein
MALLSSGNGVYYYNCRCCRTTLTMTISTSPALPDGCVYPSGCPNPIDQNCCFDMSLGFGAVPISDGDDLVSDQILILPKNSTTKVPVQNHYISGITPAKWKDLDDALNGRVAGGTPLDPSVLGVLGPYFAQFPDKRIVALYHLQFNKVPNSTSGQTSDLYIGQQVQDYDTTQTLHKVPPVKVMLGSLAYYYQIIKDDPADQNVYHVAMAKQP